MSVLVGVGVPSPLDTYPLVYLPLQYTCPLDTYLWDAYSQPRMPNPWDIYPCIPTSQIYPLKTNRPWYVFKKTFTCENIAFPQPLLRVIKKIYTSAGSPASGTAHLSASKASYILSALSIQTFKSFSTWAEDPAWISGLEDQSAFHQKI